MTCIWCQQEGAVHTRTDCPWIMPDGKSAVTIKEVPSIHCPHCTITYQEDSITQKIEESLLLNDLSHLDRSFAYEELLQAPRNMKLNLFG